VPSGWGLTTPLTPPPSTSSCPCRFESLPSTPNASDGVGLRLRLSLPSSLDPAQQTPERDAVSAREQENGRGPGCTRGTAAIPRNPREGRGKALPSVRGP